MNASLRHYLDRALRETSKAEAPTFIAALQYWSGRLFILGRFMLDRRGGVRTARGKRQSRQQNGHEAFIAHCSPRGRKSMNIRLTAIATQ
ncbi:MAG: hypothetical protein JF628_07470 [Sphingomonas sp.]|nr:hypothetical protein [Sphingomonas sp.]